MVKMINFILYISYNKKKKPQYTIHSLLVLGKLAAMSLFLTEVRQKGETHANYPNFI